MSVFSFWTNRILFCFTICLSREGLRTVLIDEHEIVRESSPEILLFLQSLVISPSKREQRFLGRKSEPRKVIGHSLWGEKGRDININAITNKKPIATHYMKRPCFTILSTTTNIKSIPNLKSEKGTIRNIAQFFRMLNHDLQNYIHWDK